MKMFIRNRTDEEWRQVPANVVCADFGEPMRLTRRNNGERDFPEWFHEAMMANAIIAHGMGKFGTGPVYLEVRNRKGERVEVYEGDLFIPDSNEMTFDIYQRRADREDAQSLA